MELLWQFCQRFILVSDHLTALLFSTFYCFQRLQKVCYSEHMQLMHASFASVLLFILTGGTHQGCIVLHAWVNQTISLHDCIIYHQKCSNVTVKDHFCAPRAHLVLKAQGPDNLSYSDFLSRLAASQQQAGGAIVKRKWFYCAHEPTPLPASTTKQKQTKIKLAHTVWEY